MNDKIYPSMVIRSQAEAIKLLEKENKRLMEENEFIKLSNPEQNIEHFRIVTENRRKINNLRLENKELKEKYLKAVADYEETKSEWQELHNKIDKVRELVKNSEWRLNDVHDLIDGYNEIEEILKDSDVDE